MRLIYLSEEEFKFLKFLRLEFLKRTGKLFVELPGTLQSGTKEETLKCATRKDLRAGIGSYTPGYEPTDISATRDSLFWRWRRVSEYYRDLSESGSIELERDGANKKRRVYKLRYSLKKDLLSRFR